MRIIYADPGSPSWNVITVVARLAARLLEAELIEVPLSQVRVKQRRALGLLPQRRGREPLLVIAPEPVDLNAVLRLDSWSKGYGPVAGWVIDSWWEDRIPRAGRSGFYDLLYVTEREFVGAWRGATRAEVKWLPQGTNALDWGSGKSSRPTTLQRVGRQPTMWDDDDRTREAMAFAGLTFGGRPPFADDAESSMAGLMGRLAQARFSLAFSPRADPQPYTHPTRDYMTGRWTDSLAAGAVVAGVPPKTTSVSDLLWPEALLDLGTIDRDAGIASIAEANARWTPDIAFTNHLRSLERLDWRWRIQTIAADLGVVTASLTAELERLERRIGELATMSHGGSDDPRTEYWKSE